MLDNQTRETSLYVSMESEMKDSFWYFLISMMHLAHWIVSSDCPDIPIDRDAHWHRCLLGSLYTSGEDCEVAVGLFKMFKMFTWAHMSWSCTRFANLYIKIEMWNLHKHVPKASWTALGKLQTANCEPSKDSPCSFGIDGWPRKLDLYHWAS